jgi:hypothetical protein
MSRPGPESIAVVLRTHRRVGAGGDRATSVGRVNDEKHPTGFWTSPCTCGLRRAEMTTHPSTARGQESRGTEMANQ